ncbi:MAG: S9 family peptidase [Chlamydiota bacterium]
MYKFLLSFLFVFTSLSSIEPITPRETFFGDFEKSQVQINPDGTKISYLASVDGILNVWIGDIDKDNAKPVTSIKNRNPSNYFWSANGDYILYLLDSGGDENEHIFALDLSTMDTKDLTPVEGSKSAVIKVSEKKPYQILVMCNERDRSVFDVYEIDINSGKKRLIYKNNEKYYNFIADDDLVIRGAEKDQKNGLALYSKENDLEPFVLLKSYDFERMYEAHLLWVSEDGHDLYFQDGADKQYLALKKYHFPEKKVEEVFYDNTADYFSTVCDPKTRKPRLIFSYGLNRNEHYCSPEFQKTWEAAKNLVNGEPIFNIIGGKHHPYSILSTKSDKIAIHYYLFNEQTLEGKFLFSGNSKLDKTELAETETISIVARDGLTLPTYLTRPKNLKGKGPMVLLVHGGPWCRDFFEYQPYRQWLADRGYSVLCVNFRGSKGFGRSHLNAGDREWSKKMHDDLIDAVNWAIENEIADPKKIAIMGGSYGGYATLVGLTFTPEVFAAGVDIVGPSHVKTLMDTCPPYWEHKRTFLNTRVAPLDDEAFMDSISPLNYVHKIKRPLLILQGRNDPRVKESESTQIVNAMLEKNIPVSYVVFPDEGHGFRMEKNRIASIAIIEQFLAKHLGGAHQPIGETVEKSSAELLHR